MRKMNKKGLLGMFAVGAIAVSGAVYLFGEKPLEEGWKRCRVYVESPSYPAFIQNVLDKIPVGIDDTMKHPESDRVKCLDLRNPGEETWNNYCVFKLTDKKDSEQDLDAVLMEEKVYEDVYRFHSLNLEGFENNPEKLMEVVENSPWIFEGALKKGYIVKSIRDEKGKITERHYELANGKKIVAVDSDGDGRLDKYHEIDIE